MVIHNIFTYCMKPSFLNVFTAFLWYLQKNRDEIKTFLKKKKGMFIYVDAHQPTRKCSLAISIIKPSLLASLARDCWTNILIYTHL